jgi:hypothetical protein
MSNGTIGSPGSLSKDTIQSKDGLVPFLDEVVLEAVDAGYQLAPTFTRAQVRKIVDHAKERLVIYITARDHQIHEHVYQLGKRSK